MKNLLKYVGIGIACTVLLLALALLVSPEKAQAQGSLTDGHTMTNTRASLIAATSLWWRVYGDQSTYPNQGKRYGTLVRLYHFDRDGGAVSTISLEKGKSVTNVPDNLLVKGGHLEIMTPLTSAGTFTTSVGIVSTTDLIPLSTTNLSRAAGIYELTPRRADWTSWFSTTSQTPAQLVVQGNAVTAGVFMVVLDVYQRQ